jgi:uncharacterized membrane protein (DUF4010 family)
MPVSLPPRMCRCLRTLLPLLLLLLLLLLLPCLPHAHVQPWAAWRGRERVESV